MKPRIKFYGWILLAAWALSACQTVPTVVPAGVPAQIQVTATAAADVPPGMTAQAAATLRTLTRVDDYPLYTMHFQGAYPLAAGPSGVLAPAAANPQPFACALFAALADPENRLFGRNFDWNYSPALLLFTDPPDGYASASLVDFAYLGFDQSNAKTLADAPLSARAALLHAPELPFDGMNEKGLAIGMAAVPPGNLQPDPRKPSIDSLLVIREILDHAASVDEAVNILGSYNIDPGGGPPLHYLAADVSGRAVLVEFSQGKMVVIPNEDGWHLATNFLRAEAGGDPGGICWRYDALAASLSQAGGRLTAKEAMPLLKNVAQNNPGGATQWSVVYEMSSGDIHVAVGQQYERVHHFHLDR